jgi:hypothetical protein
MQLEDGRQLLCHHLLNLQNREPLNCQEFDRFARSHDKQRRLKEQVM